MRGHPRLWRRFQRFASDAWSGLSVDASVSLYQITGWGVSFLLLTESACCEGHRLVSVFMGMGIECRGFPVTCAEGSYRVSLFGRTSRRSGPWFPSRFAWLCSARPLTRYTGIRPPSTPHFPLSVALGATAPLSRLAFVILPFSSLIRIARGLPVLLVFFSVAALSR